MLEKVNNKSKPLISIANVSSTDQWTSNTC